MVRRIANIDFEIINLFFLKIMDHPVFWKMSKMKLVSFEKTDR